MRFLSKKVCLTFIPSVLVTVLLMTLIPFNAITVSAVEGDGPYEIYVIDEKTGKPVEGAVVVLDSDDEYVSRALSFEEQVVDEIEVEDV